MKRETAIELTKGALALVKGCENMEVKFLEQYESDNVDKPLPAIQIGSGDGEMWIYKGIVEIEEPSRKLVGGAMDKRKVEGYVLEALVVEHNYPHEPDWVDVVVQHENQSFLALLMFLSESLFGQMANNYAVGAEYKIDSEERPWPGDREESSYQF
jgi:hypothetical protein